MIQSLISDFRVILSPLERYRSCLLGGAAGDALGAPVEFMSFAQIRDRFGRGGIRDFAPAHGRVGAITDDTQMSLFTAEGLLRALVRYDERGVCHVPSVVHRAYIRWLGTQDHKLPFGPDNFPDDLGPEWLSNGWLIDVEDLWERRAPGNTCLSALRGTKRIGEPAKNNSKGCGGVMRAAPVGLIAIRERAFELGMETAALTHGHPSGYLAAGVLAPLIQQVITGLSLQDALRTAELELIAQPEHDEVLNALQAAETLTASGPSQSSVGKLGEGWVAEEALAIAVYCAMAAPNFEEAVVLAVNHSGDSDSTGAITGNICGALYSDSAIPTRWTDSLELSEEITALAADIGQSRSFDVTKLELSDNERFWKRYPGW